MPNNRGKMQLEHLMNLGYAATGSSPELSAKLRYFLKGRDETVMNRDRLLNAITLIGEMQDNYRHQENQT